MNLLSLDYKKNKHKISLVFIIATLAALIIIMLPFIIRGNYLLWGEDAKDGITQHASFFAYLKSTGAFLNIGTFDFYSGLGNDYLFSYIYYMILDPFNIVLLIPINNIPFLYSLSIILKFLASGYFMFLYLKHKNIMPIVNIVISVFYMLSGFAVFTFIRHPDLAAGAVFLPLMVLGIEKILNNERPYVLIVSAFLCLCSSFYLFFMSSVFIVAYTILYYFEINSDKSFKKFSLAMLKNGGFYLLAIMLASFFLVPLVFMYPTAARTISKGLNFYNLKYYLGLMLSLITSICGTFYTALGTNIIVLALIIPFYCLKGNKTLKTMIFVMSVCLLFPIFGYAFNLFNYVNNRWIYLLDFVLSVAAAITLNRFSYSLPDEKTKRKVKLCLSGFLIVFAYSALVYLGIYLIKRYYTVLFLIIILILLFFILVAFIYLFACIFKEKILKVNFKFTFSGLLIALYSLTVFMPFVYYINYSQEFSFWNQYYTQQTQEEKYISVLNETEFFRTDTGNADKFFYNYTNNGIINEYLSTFNYNTLSNGLVYKFFLENGIYNSNNNLGISGLNKRSAIASLLSVKYYLNNDLSLPYGFNESLENYNKIYSNDNYLPLGIVYNKSVSKAYYDSLSYLEKQALMLEAVVLDNGEVYNYTQKTYNGSYEMQLNNVRIQNNVISADKNSTIVLTLEGCENKEVYLSLNNFVLEEDDIFYNGIIFDKKVATFNISDGNIALQQKIYPYGHQMYTGQTDFSYCLGYSENGEKTITLTFFNDYKFSFDDINITLYDMTDYQNSVNNLKNNSLNNVVYDNNGISGDITMNETGYLFLSVPFMEGFSAKVNGTETEILKADTAFMALKLESGYNKIEINYKTPYLNIGNFISLASLSILILIIIKDIIVLKKRNKMSSKNT